ncbi:5-(carboxyamino)imidazole ribonucleotide synthase [Pedomonas sp. V897]|uniref:5-(carboxyamino)imidazole ribonucleotide synthase n=1 Tax=Pedomonas sp. V897 TaxID=3446482 RepID=UPI003EE02874
MTVLPPGSTIGILGGGQLGRMIAQAAARLGYRCHIFCPEIDGPASHVAAKTVNGAFEDEDALRAFVKDVDIVTYEFENVPAATARLLSEHAPLAPNARALEVAQDRITEKSFVRDLGLGVPAFRAVSTLEELEAAIAEIGTPAILKTRRFGYDGKGQARLATPADAAAAWDTIGRKPAILEAMVAFDGEVSVLVARGQDGRMVHYGPVHNVHKNGILDISRVPAPFSEQLAASAVATAEKIATALDYVGVLAIELFVVGDTVLFNEMAPRVHNSGHWTIEGAVTSQFENHVRAICGLPLGATDPLGRVEMRNLIGEDANHWQTLLADPTLHVHLYGKREARPGRKMGHTTRVVRD